MNFLAGDLGATSGRLMLGEIQDGAIRLTELARFSNEMAFNGKHKVWDIQQLIRNLLDGVKDYSGPVDSFAVDTWGVDYGYIDAGGNLLGDVAAYRDPRTDPVCERVVGETPDLYSRTGIQIMPFNTIFQVIEDVESRSQIVEKASRLLQLPDLINQIFTGVAANEYTIASTSALLDMRTGQWDRDIMKKYGVRAELFQEVALPGRVLGDLKSEYASAAGRTFPVCLTAGHDTASAVAGVPVLPGRKWGYISSGTWSLVGVERDSPVINDDSIKYEITNEGGVEGTIRFLKNVPGMWLLEESLREWKAKGGSYEYDQIVRAARESEPFQSILDPTDPRFNAPESMLAVIGDFCRETAQPVPESVGEVARCIFESLALRYGEVFEEIAQCTGEEVDEVHVVSGGSRNALLNQMTANACGKTVFKGPAEATVIGNIAVQAIALGVFKDLADYREQQAQATPITQYEPEDERVWRKAYARFKELRRRSEVQ